jgi:hypothetical protein
MPETPIGMLLSGNIDLAGQPRVSSPEGISTIRSISVNLDGKEILIPTVSQTGNRILSDTEAIQQYKKTGRHLGVFSTPSNATRFARRLHTAYESGKIGRLPSSPELTRKLEKLLGGK